MAKNDTNRLVTRRIPCFSAGRRDCLLLGIAIVLCFAFLGCSGQQLAYARAANEIARVSNAALELATSVYRDQGLTAVITASSAVEAKAAVQVVKERWQPAWLAWEGYRGAFDSAATALEQNEDSIETAVAIESMRAGFCAFRAALRAKLVTVSTSTIRCNP